MNITFVGSPNYSAGRAGKPISYIVVHHMAGNLAGADAVFQDKQRNTSAHYGVGRNGEIHQYVSEKDTAYHAGNFDINQRSIGIEHEDLNADNYTDIEYQTSAELIRKICTQYDLPINGNIIRPHRAFTATACPGTLDIGRLIQLANKDNDMFNGKTAQEWAKSAEDATRIAEDRAKYLAQVAQASGLNPDHPLEQKDVEQIIANIDAKNKLIQAKTTELNPGVYLVK